MLVGHLLLALLSGVVAALVSWSLGFSLWATLWCFVLWGNLGLMASALAVT